MTIRTHKIVHADTNETLYESTCTINGNKIDGCINPFPYMNRKMRKLGVRPVRMSEANSVTTLFVK